MSCCAAVACNPEMIEHRLDAAKRMEEARIAANSVELSDGVYKTDFIVPDMHCASCIGAIERGLAELAPVLQVRANLSLKTVSVVWDSNSGSINDIRSRLEALGFDNHLSDGSVKQNTHQDKTKSLLLALAVAGFAAANIMLLSVSVWSGADAETAHLFHLISGLIAVPAVAFSGQPFFRSAINALASKRLNMDVPISLAVLLALGMSFYEGLTGGSEAYFDASVTLLFFLLIGRYLDSLMRQKASSAAEQLTSLSCKNGVLILPNGEVSYVPLKEIQSGMRLRVFPGERFPVDGLLDQGATNLDKSHVTGESTPVSANCGDMVAAGTLNISSPVDFTATSDATQSFLGEMQRMMQEAENGRGAYTRIADRMAQIYAPAVHMLALLAFIAWMIATGGDWHTSLYVAIAVLIITCPCALGLAVPVAHVIAATKLMQNGILMRDGSALERLAEVNTAVFDKTGTLTNGTLKVAPPIDSNSVRNSYLRALAASSTHPFSQAVLNELPTANVISLDSVTEVPGCGVEGMHKGKKLRLGKPKWVSKIAASDCTPQPEHSISFALEGKNAIHFDVRDRLRNDAREAIDRLSKHGLSLEILSGDQSRSVEAIAHELGFERYSARQTPTEKIDRIRELERAGNRTLMVGDGINDGPALTSGHVSFAPASASDVGRHASDFIFTRDSLIAVPFAYQVAVFTARIVKQNFGLAIAYNCIAVPLAMAGYITPLIAAIAMSASSLVVVSNSFRIKFLGHTFGKVEPKHRPKRRYIPATTEGL